MKVANVIEDARLAGPQIRIVEVAKRLRSLGVETVVICPNYDNEQFCSKLKEHGIARVSLPLRRLNKSFTGLVYYILCFPWEIFLLWRELRSGEYLIVHCSGGAWQIKAVIAGKFAGKNVVWHLNDTSMPWVIRIVFTFVVRLADSLIVAGERVRKYYIDELGVKKPCFEVQAPVDTNHFDPSRVKSDERLAGSALKVVVVGNVNPFKGIEYFVQMAGILRNKQLSNMEFFIVGSLLDSQKSYWTNLQRVIELNKLSDTVKFFGPAIDVRKILKAADIYVCSSVSEASPIAVWEAMAMGKPIVTTDVGDVARFVENGISGLVVPSKNAQALAAGVERFVLDKSLRESCGRLARECAVSKLDIHICVDAHLCVYKALSVGKS